MLLSDCCLAVLVSRDRMILDSEGRLVLVTITVGFEGLSSPFVCSAKPINLTC